MSNATTTDATATVDTYIAMWNETDPAKRAALIERAWTSDGRYLDPPLDCVGARCNTPYQQFAYNAVRDEYLLVADRLGDYLLDRYGLDGREALEAQLTGDLSEHVLPLLSPAEIAWTIARVEAELDRLGGGDRAAGAEIVRERVNRWALNKIGD